jgi:hypothetical protein
LEQFLFRGRASANFLGPIVGIIHVVPPSVRYLPSDDAGSKNVPRPTAELLVTA